MSFARRLFVLALLGACATSQAHPLDVRPETAALRKLQTRRYDTRDEVLVLRAAGALLQDHGFTLDSSEHRLGVLIASKDRPAIEWGDYMLAVLTDSPYQHHQRLRASVVTYPVGEKSVAVRVTFQRIVWNSAGVESKREAMDEPEYYVEFFRKLSSALFLEAHEL